MACLMVVFRLHGFYGEKHPFGRCRSIQRGIDLVIAATLATASFSASSAEMPSISGGSPTALER